MDADIREALREIRESQRELSEKIDSIRDGWANCRVACAGDIREAMSVGKAAHKRLDQKDTHRATLWIGVVLAMVSSLFAWILGAKL